MFFPSSLVISSDPLLTIEELLSETLAKLGHHQLVNNADIFIINENSGWGIDSVRQIKSFLANKPFNHSSKIVIIDSADKLSGESQNALLKMIEEPGDNNYFFLVTSKPLSLLVTISSRCHHIRISRTNNNSGLSSQLVVTGNLSQDLALAEKLSQDKPWVLTLLESELDFYQKQLVLQPTASTFKTIQKIIRSLQLIKANVDPKSALDYFFLT